jgi:hypothetical protein
MASNVRIWQRLALSSTWPFSKTGHERQMRSHRKEDGSVDWKRVNLFRLAFLYLFYKVLKKLVFGAEAF